MTAVLGASIPVTLTDDAGNALKNVQVLVTGPSAYSQTLTTSADGGVLQLVDVPAGTYTVTLGARSVSIPVLPYPGTLATAVQQAAAAETPAGAQAKISVSVADALTTAALDAQGRATAAQSAAVVAAATDATTKAGAAQAAAIATAATDATAKANAAQTAAAADAAAKVAAQAAAAASTFATKAELAATALIVDNGDGTLTLAGPATDNGDGTLTLAA